MAIDHESYELLIEDKFFDKSHVKFIKTSTFMLVVEAKGGDDTLTILLTEDDVDRIREFLKNWDDDAEI